MSVEEHGYPYGADWFVHPDYHLEGVTPEETPEQRYYRELLYTQSIGEAAALGPEPVFDSLAEAVAAQPDIIAMIEDDEVHIERGEN